MTFLRILTVNTSHIFAVDKGPDGRLKGTGGADFILLDLLSKHVPFEYELIEQKDHLWGTVGEDGNWTGMIGALQREEMDMAFGWIANTYVRDQVVDFSFPYMVDAIAFFTPSPHISPKDFDILDPFHAVVWILLLLSLPVSAAVLTLLGHPSVNGEVEKRGSVRRFIVELERLVGMFIGQGTFKVYSSIRCRIFVGLVTASRLVLVFSYCSTLLSLMMVPTSERPIDTLQQLRDSVVAGQYQVAVYRGISHYEFLMASESELLKDLANNLRHHPENVLRNFEDGLQRLNDGQKLATLVMSLHFRFVSSMKGDWLFHISRETIGYNPVSVALKRGFPYTERINRIILRITESGIYLWNLENMRYKLSLKAPLNPTATKEKRALTLADITMPLQILVGAHGLAVILLIVELLHHRITNRKSRNA